MPDMAMTLSGESTQVDQNMEDEMTRNMYE
jgi:hypothetical protein